MLVPGSKSDFEGVWRRRRKGGSVLVAFFSGDGGWKRGRVRWLVVVDGEVGEEGWDGELVWVDGARLVWDWGVCERAEWADTYGGSLLVFWNDGG